MKALKRRLVFLLVAALALYVSNPSIEQHQLKIEEKFKEENPIAGKLGVGGLVKEIVAYENYYLCSIGKVSVADKPISFGIAGFVLVFTSLDLMKYKDMIPK